MEPNTFTVGSCENITLQHEAMPKIPPTRDEQRGHQEAYRHPGRAGDLLKRDHGTNLFLLVWHQIIFRVGWTFKTESVILPGFLDFLIGPGAGVYRGFLPILNRLGQGIVPVFLARSMDSVSAKRFSLVVTATALAVPLFLAALLAREHGSLGQQAAGVFFLLIYFGFSAGYGLYQVAFNTVQGKLIRPDYRGRLMSYSTFWGTIPAVLVSFAVLRIWLSGQSPHYERVFLSGACLFVLSGLLCIFLRESKGDESFWDNASRRVWRPFWDVLRSRPGLRSLCLVGMIYSFSLALVPHYQAFARERLHIPTEQQYLWVIAQSASVGIFSVAVGWLADRYGNRLTFSLLVFGSVLTPAWCLLMLHFSQGLAEATIWLTFVTLAFTTLAPRMAVNYALEMVPPEEHAVATAAFQLGITLPLLASPLWGWLIERWGFEGLLRMGIFLTAIAGVMSAFLPEPRFRPTPPPPSKLIPSEE